MLKNKIKNKNESNKSRYNSKPVSLEMIENVCVLRTKFFEKEILSLTDIYGFLVKYQDVYISNISFIDKYSNYFSNYYCNSMLHLAFYDVLQNYNQVLNKLVFKKVKSISVFVLKGFEILKNIDDCVVICKKDSDIYVISEYRIVFTPEWNIKFNFITARYLYIDNIDVSRLKTLKSFFMENYNLETIILKNFDISNATSLSAMFYGCVKLKNINIDCFNTENIENFSYMFYGCVDLKCVNLNTFNTYKGRNFEGMFLLCDNLETVYMENCCSPYIETVKDMFKGCKNLKYLSCSKLLGDNRNLNINKQGMLEGCINLKL